MAKNKSSIPAATSPSFDPQTLAAPGSDAPSVLARESTRAVELVEAWIAAKNADAVVAIVEHEKAAPLARKAARRGIQVLKSRGVPIPERSHVARLTVEETLLVEAWAVSPDASGSMLLVIASHTPTSRYRMAQVVVQPGVGILQAQPTELNGSQIRGWMEDLERRLGHKPVPVPVEWARARVAQAKADQAKSRFISPLGVDLVKDLVEPAPAETPEHPIDAAKLELPGAATVMLNSAMLHGEPEFHAWVPPSGAVQALVALIGQELGRHGTPEAPPDEAKFEQIMASSLNDLTDRFFTPEIRQQLAATMKDAAISVLARVGRERAAQVLAVANAVATAGLITNPPHEIPFLRAFFQKAIALLAAQNAGRLSIPVQMPARQPATEAQPEQAPAATEAQPEQAPAATEAQPEQAPTATEAQPEQAPTATEAPAASAGETTTDAAAAPETAAPAPQAQAAPAEGAAS